MLLIWVLAPGGEDVVCISSAYFSILINGSPKEFFQARRVISQGDPLSQFLLMIVDEALCRLLEVAGNGNLIEGFKLVSSGPIIAHLQVLDGTLIFCDVKEDQIKNVKAALFGAICLLRMGYEK